MPNLFLEPEKDPGADPIDAERRQVVRPGGRHRRRYLLASSKTDWQPMPAASDGHAAAGARTIRRSRSLMLEYLNEAFYKDAADDYYLHGIPPELEGELKGAEKDLIVQPGQTLTDEQRLKYIGRKTIAKYGCFGCHDIPGFEDAKPIGTGLADWGRKDPAKLAFEHITHYIGARPRRPCAHGDGQAATSDARCERGKQAPIRRPRSSTPTAPRRHGRS